MKKLILIFFLFSMLITSLIGHVVFNVLTLHAKSTLKKELKKNVPEKKLHAFTFDIGKSPNWIVENKEFNVDGQLYDIVKTKHAKDKITFLCISDKEETILFSHLGPLILKHVTKKGNPKNHSLIQLLKTTYVSNDLNVTCCQLPNIRNTKALFAPLHFLFKSETIEIDSPPPLTFS